MLFLNKYYKSIRKSLGDCWAPTSSWCPFWLALGPYGLLDVTNGRTRGSGPVYGSRALYVTPRPIGSNNE